MKANAHCLLALCALALVPAAPLAAETPASAGESPAHLQSAPEIPAYPLDPLTRDELKTLHKILSGRFSDKTVYTWVQLREPPKEEVLAFRPGAAFRREAFVALLSPEKKTACEVIVDLNARSILSVKELGNAQPFLTDPDYDSATEAIDGSAEVRAALEKRGYKLGGTKVSEALYLDMYAPGLDLQPAADGAAAAGSSLEANGKTIRAVRVLFADRQGGTNDYGPYLEGLMAMVDVYGRRVIEVFDRPGPQIHVKAPGDIFDRAILGPKIAESPLDVGPPAAKAISIQGNHVRWGQWDFRYGFNLREGLVLYRISYDDGGRVRPICYRASVSEMLVPYSSPSQGWLWREFFDAGEYGLGYVSNAAEPGKELPVNAVSIDAVLPDTKLEASPDFPSRVFLFERDGGALFAHTQDEGGHRVYARAKELVIGFIATVGNYDYIYQWVFRQDASFGFEAELEGLILNKTVDDGTCQVCDNEAAAGPGTYRAKGEQAFGTLVSPQVLGVFHQHWINLRLDFDVDGTVNAVKETNTVPVPFDPVKNPRGRAFTAETTVFGREQEAQRTCNAPTNREWVVYNPEARSALGHPSGYAIEPVENTESCIPASRWGDTSSFTQRHLWVTKYRPDELYAAGRYPNQAPEDSRDDLFNYAAGNENIYKEDVVVWYSLGFTHVTKPEDYPLMPGKVVGVNFAPDGFFAKSPATGHATVESHP
jgi:primary-amine oxidase